MMGAWLEATQNYLRQVCGYDVGECDAQPDGKPPPSMGEYHIAVHEAGQVSRSDVNLLQEFMMDVTLTKRTGQYPTDQHTSVFLDNQRGIDALTTEIIPAIHINHNLMVLANDLLPSAVAAFQSPMFFLTAEISRMETGAWALGPASSDDSFMVKVIHFGGARVLQG